MGKVIRLFFFVLIVSGLATVAAPVQPADLLKDPTPREWAALSRFDGTLTRAQFEDRLKGVFDPFGGLSPFLRITDSEVVVSSVTNAVTPVATISFAFANQDTPEPKEIDSPLRSPTDSQEEDLEESLPLNGLKVVIDPADIGGSWGPMEDRSSYYRGYGRIQEGDLNLLVSSLLSERLRQLGAEVFVTRETAEPVCVASVPDVAAIVPAVLSGRPHMLLSTFRSRTRNIRKSSPIYERIVAEVLLTKNLEARARAEKARNAMQPDITIVLQFDASPSSGYQRLSKTNRNILFVEGAYTAKELDKDPRQRLRLLTKLLQDVAPVERRVAVAIANRLSAATGFPAVLYGNSKITRAIEGSPYVVARNLLLPREHDGPVVVTEPYFMNEATTLERLLAGDFDGTREIAGKPRASIYREYADAVADGLLDAFGTK